MRNSVRSVHARKASLVLISAVSTLGIGGIGASWSRANLQFILTQTSSMTQQQLDGYNAAAARWSANFTNDVTVRINIGVSATLGSGVIASTGSTENLTATYTNFKTALANVSSGSADDLAAISNLPAAASMSLYINRTSDNPNGSGSATPFVDTSGGNTTTIRPTQANMRALGLYNGAGSDASMTFSSTFAFDFDPSNGISAGQIDFIGVVTHEIGHALGFISGVDVLDGNSGLSSNQLTYVSPVDVFRYSAESTALGAQDFAADMRAKYFSLNKGVNSIAGFSTGVSFGDGRQASHWKDSLNLGIMDPTAGNAELQTISEFDRRLFDAIGWNRDNTWEWVQPAGGNFLDPRRWNADGITSSAQDGVFELGVVYSANVTLSPITIAQYGTVVTGNVRDLIDRKDTLTFAADNANRALNVARNFIVGDTSGAAASFTFAQGILNSPTTMIAQNPGSTGTLSFTGGTWTNSGSVYVGGTAGGAAGTGLLLASAGSLKIQTSAVVYPAATLALSGTSLLTTPLLDVRGGQVTGAASNLVVKTLSSTGGQVTISGPLTVGSTGMGTINISPAGSVAVTGALTVLAAGSITQTGGLLVAASTVDVGTIRVSGGIANLGAVTGSGSNSVSATGSLTASSIQLGRLSITGTARANLSGGSLTDPSDFASLDVASTALLDLTNQAAVVHNGSLTTLRSLAQSWWNLGLRNGTGIGSSSASLLGFTTIAVFQNIDSDGLPYYASYGSLALMSSDIIMRYDYVGDTNGDGVLNGIDAANILEGISTGQTGWQNGDVNYDGLVNTLDYTLFLAGLNANLPSLGSPSDIGSSSGGSIPEPSSMAMVAPAFVLLGRRRRR